MIKYSLQTDSSASYNAGASDDLTGFAFELYEFYVQKLQKEYEDKMSSFEKIGREVLECEYRTFYVVTTSILSCTIEGFKYLQKRLGLLQHKIISKNYRRVISFFSSQTTNTNYILSLEYHIN